MAEMLTLRIRPCQWESLSVSLATARLAVQYAIREAEDVEGLAHTLQNIERLLTAAEEAEANEESTERGIDEQKR